MKIENDQINSYENAEIGGECEFWWKKMQSQTYKFSNENRKQGRVITKTWFLGEKRRRKDYGDLNLYLATFGQVSRYIFFEKVEKENRVTKTWHMLLAF